MKTLLLLIVSLVVAEATGKVSKGNGTIDITDILPASTTTPVTEVDVSKVALGSPLPTNVMRSKMQYTGKKINKKYKETLHYQRIAAVNKLKRALPKPTRTRKGKRRKSITPPHFSLVTPVILDSTLASTMTSTTTTAPPPFTFTNITIRRKVANNTEMSVTIFFIWPSFSLPPTWFTTISPNKTPSSSSIPSPASRNFSVDIHLAKVSCLSRELHCALIPETVYFKVMVPLDEWVRVTIDQSFFIYNTRYFIQLYNNNISTRSESKEFTTPSCKYPAKNFRTCLDAKNDVTSGRHADSGTTGLIPRVVCLAMDESGLDKHEMKFRIDWNIERNLFMNITNQTAEKVDMFLKAQTTGKTSSEVSVYSPKKKFLVGLFNLKTTSFDVDLAADDEFIVEIVTKYEDWTVVYELLKLKTKIEILKKKLLDGNLSFCHDAALPVGKGQVKSFIIIVIVVIAVIFLFITACLIISWNKCREINMNKTVLTKENSYKSSSVNLLRESVSTCGSVTDEWEIEANDLELGKEVGQGAFGKVVCGFYKMQRVAVKVLKDDIQNLYREDLLREIALLKSLGTHQSIVSILGASTLKEPLALVMEFMPYGNLYNFLRRCRCNFDWRQESRELVSIQCMHDETSGDKEVWEVTSKDLISWARQAAIAMEYLASKQYVHRDLAARNILLGTNKTIKLCDFGLARLIYRGDGHYFRKTNTKLPIKWMALESIRDRIYTSRSDVWSFGILLWEIATFGSCPYPTISVEDLPRYLEEGYRMPQPSNSSDELYLMMMDCWRSNPEDRPTFSEIRSQLEDMLSRDVDYLDLEVADGESPFSVNRMPNNENDNNNNNHNGVSNNDKHKNNNNKSTVINQKKSPGKTERSNVVMAPTVDNKSSKEDEQQETEEVNSNLSLPRLVKSKEIAIDKALVKSAAGKSFGGKIADNVFYHKSVVHDAKKIKNRREEGTNDKPPIENLDTTSPMSHHPPHPIRQSRLTPHPPQITINSDTISESFPLLQLSPPPTSPIHSNFRLLDPATDSGELESMDSSDRSPSGDTEETRSSWMLDII